MPETLKRLIPPRALPFSSTTPADGANLTAAVPGLTALYTVPPATQTVIRSLKLWVASSVTALPWILLNSSTDLYSNRLWWNLNIGAYTPPGGTGGSAAARVPWFPFDHPLANGLMLDAGDTLWGVYTGTDNAASRAMIYALGVEIS